MGTLLNKANEILSEKTNKIIPENIKAGIEIYDVTGTYRGGQNETLIKLLKSEMDEYIAYIKSNITMSEYETKLQLAQMGDDRAKIPATIVIHNISDKTLTADIIEYDGETIYADNINVLPNTTYTSVTSSYNILEFQTFSIQNVQMT